MAVYTVSGANNDARENVSNGTINVSNISGSSTSQLNGQNHAGFRFQNIPIAKGAGIASAVFTFPQLANKSGSGNMSHTRVYGENSPGSAQWSTNYGISGRLRTNASVPLGSVPATTGAYSIDVTKIVQEIVSHRSWGSGAPLALIFWADGSNSANLIDPFRQNLYPPTLDITLTTGQVIKTAVTVTQDTPLAGEGTWTNLNNAIADDGSVASGNISQGGQSAARIRFSNFGFTIPNGAVINGIKVEVDGSGQSVFDNGVYLMKQNAHVGYDHSLPIGYLWQLPGWQSYGGIGDDWGEGWSYSDINAPGFGVSLKYSNTSGGGSVSIDSVRITVYYNNPGYNSYTVKQTFTATPTNIAATSGNQALQRMDNFRKIINNTGNPINLAKLSFRVGALIATTGGDPKSGQGGTTYDRSGTPLITKFYTNLQDMINGTNPLQTWEGTLRNPFLETYDYELSSPYLWNPGATIYVVQRATGVSGVSEPDFMTIGGTNWYGGTDDDPNQTFANERYDSDPTPTSVSAFYIAYDSKPPAPDASAFPEGNSNIVASGYDVQFGSASLGGGSDISVAGFLMGYGSALAVGDSKAFADRIYSVGGSNITVDGTVDPLIITKSYMYKIYDENWNYLGAWNDVVSEFGYSQEINSAGSSIDIVLARNSDSLTSNYDVISNDDGTSIITDDGNELAAETSTLNAIGPGTTVDLNLNVKVYEFSSLTSDISGDLVYTGYISRYVSQYGSSEQTKVTVFSYGADLDNWLLTDQEGNTRVPYLSQDPSDILRTTLDRFQAEGGLIGYDNGVPGDTEVVTNLIANPSFETNTTGWTTGAGSVTRVTTGGNSGNAYLQIQNVSGGRVDYLTGNLVAGTAYRLSFYLKRPANGTVNITGYHNSSTVFDLNVAPPITWTRYDIQFNAVTNTPLSFSIAIIGSDNQVHIDSVMLTAGPELIDYFDGATTDDNPDTTFAWTGTANNSTSTRSTVLNNVGASIEDTNTIVTYAFNLNTELEVIKKALELAPTDWYFYTDLATNLLHFHPRPKTPNHLFFLGKHILNLNLERSMEGIVNDYILTGGKATALITDNFFGSNGTTLQAHIGEEGASWSKHPTATGGSLVIEQNRIRNASASEVIYVASATGTTNDMTISADVRVLTNTGAGIELLLRVDPTAKTFYMARVLSGNAEIYKFVNGTPTILGSTAVTVNPSTTYAMEFSTIGTRITFKFGGNTVVDIDDGSIPYGYKAGLRSNAPATTSTTGYHLNNFKVKQGGETGPAIFKRYIDQNSINNYRRGLSRVQDNRVSVESSADIIALTEIARNNKPRYRSQITISNGAYEIKNIKLGQLVGFRNFGNYVDDVTMQVVRIDYKPDSVDLQLDTLLPSVPKRLEDIKRNLNQSDVEDNPDAPELN